MKIHRFKDFVSVNDQNKILEFCKINPRWSPIVGDKKFFTQQKNMLIGSGDNLHLFGIKEMLYILEQYSEKISLILHDKNLIQENILSMPPALFKYSKGYNLPVHMDTKYSKWITYASVLYFNSEYSGGELSFPNFNIIITPEPGELILFSQEDSQYAHEVKRNYARRKIYGTKLV